MYNKEDNAQIDKCDIGDEEDENQETHEEEEAKGSLMPQLP